MPWSLKRWWQGVGIATIAFELICLVVSPNPLSILLLPVGAVLIGGAFPIGWDAAVKTFDTTKEWSARFWGLMLGLFCLGILKLGLQLVWASFVVAFAVLDWKIGG